MAFIKLRLVDYHLFESVKGDRNSIMGLPIKQIKDY